MSEECPSRVSGGVVLAAAVFVGDLCASKWWIWRDQCESVDFVCREGGRVTAREVECGWGTAYAGFLYH